MVCSKRMQSWVGLTLILAFLLGWSVVGWAQERTGAWVDEVVLSEEPSAAAALSRLEAGEIDLYSFTVSDPEIYQRILSSDALGYEQAFGSYTELTFNTAGPVFPGSGKLNPFAVPRIREAVNWLIDREYIADEIYGGMAVPRYFPIHTAFPDYARLVDVARALELTYAPDPAKAEAVISSEMEKLGAERVNGTWHYKGEPVTLIFVIRSEDERREIGDYVATLFEDIGFAVDRQYKTAAAASAVWIQGDPNAGEFHIYTGGWITTAINRDEGGSFEYFYTPRGLAFPLWQFYSPTPEFDELADRLNRNDFQSLEERKELYAQALEASMQDSVRIYIADRFGVIPRTAELSVAADLAGGVSGTLLWAHTIRRGDEIGGTLNVAVPSILPEPWNPLDGSNWVYDQMLIRATIDAGVIPDPFTGLPLPQRVERAEVFLKEGLPVGQSLDWVDLNFVDEIQVPGDAWIDWDPEAQRFIKAEELYPQARSALRKSVVYYPNDLYEHTWHDGSPLSVADFVMGMILTFDGAKEASAYFDETKASVLESFMRSFKGVRILSTQPLIIETYSDQYALDAEMNAESWFPTYTNGPGPWHTLALGLKAEAAGEAAFSSAKAGKLGVEWMSFIGGPSLGILSRHLEEAKAESYVPYAATLRQYATALEIADRWQNLSAWYAKRGHFWVGSGPLMLERAFPVESIAHLKRFEAYGDPSDKWARFQEPRIAEVALDGSRRVRSGQSASFDVTIDFDDEAYPTQDIETVTYLVFDANGALALSGNAEPVSEGSWRLELSAEQTQSLPTGSNRLEVIVVPRVVSIPTFDTFQFVTTP